MNALGAGNEEKAEQVLEEFIDGLTASCRYSVLRTRFRQLYQAVETLPRTFGGEVGDSTSFELLLARCHSIADLKAVFTELFGRISLQSQMHRQQQEDEIVARVKETVQKRYMEPGLSLSSIAQDEETTAEVLGDLFRLAEGLSVAKYINQVRFDHARELLLSTDLSVAEIAQRTGFSNAQYFFTLFKASFGQTPSEYRHADGGEARLI